ncbi:hypothetical protein P9705_001286 [Enterococcus faecalis]|nr:hypothetical protein [Enterococcus faecalis]
MAKLIELKESMVFYSGVTPVLALSLNPELIKKANSEEKEGKKQREFAKLNKLFSSKVGKDNLKKGYEIIEDFKKFDDVGVDPILDRDPSVVTSKTSFAYLSNLTSNDQSCFVAGVRFLDEDGEVALIPDDVPEFSGVASVETDITTAIEQYDNVLEALEKYDDEFVEDGEPDNYVADDAEIDSGDKEVFVEVEESFDEDDEIKPGTEQSELDGESGGQQVVEIEKTVIPTHDLTEEVDTSTENVKYEQDSISDSFRSETYSPESFKGNVESIISQKFEFKKLDPIDFPIKMTKEIERVKELAPLMTVTNTSMNNRIREANRKIEEEREQSLARLIPLAQELLERELSNIEKMTSLDDEESEFYARKIQLESDYEKEKQKIEDAVSVKSKVLRQSYEARKKEFVDEVRKKAEIQFDDENEPKLKVAELDYRNEITQSLKEQFEEGMQTLMELASNRRDESKKEVIDNVLAAMADQINKESEAAKHKVLAIVSETVKENEQESKNLKEKALEVALKANETKNRVEEVLDHNSKQISLVEKEKSQLEKDIANMKDMYDSQSENLKKLKQENDRLATDLKEANQNYAQFMSMKTDTEMKMQQELQSRISDSSNSDMSKRKMLTTLGLASIAAVTVMGSVLAFSMNRPVDRQQVEATQVSNLSEKRNESEESKALPAIPTTSKKVGETIKIDPSNNGSSVPAVIKSIDNGIALVQTSDGNQYSVSLKD